MKKITLFFGLVLLLVFFSGCSSNTTTTNEENTVLEPSSIYRSEDGGMTWVSQLDPTLDLPGMSVLSLAVNPFNSDLAFFGLETGGILKTEDGGASWQKLSNFKAEKVYGLALDPTDPRIIYASGVWQKRGKIYKSLNSGDSWKELYTEAAEGPLVISLAIDKNNPLIIYATNSENGVLQSINGGTTWKNIFRPSVPITNIIIAQNDSKKIYLLGENKIFRSLDGGKSFLDITKKLADSLKIGLGSFYAGTTDSLGVLYIGGENGILKSINQGETWEKIETLNDSNNFPVRALAVSPANDMHLLYGAAMAVYRSEDGGATWSSFQIDSDSIARALQFNLENPDIAYFALFEK